MKPSTSPFLLLFTLFAGLACLPVAGYAQAGLEGAWAVEVSLPAGGTFRFDLRMEEGADSLRLTAALGDAQVRLPGVSFADGRLRFDVPLGHGALACNVYRRDADAFAGVCVGPMGESVTTLRRKNR